MAQQANNKKSSDDDMLTNERCEFKTQMMIDVFICTSPFKRQSPTTHTYALIDVFICTSPRHFNVFTELLLFYR